MKVKNNAPLGASLIVLSSVFYASYGIWVALMGNFFGGYTASALRSAIVLLILIPIAWLWRKFEPLDLRHNWPWLLGMFMASTLVWGPLYFAIVHAGVGVSLGINYAALVIGMFLFGWIFLKERFTKDKFIATCLGIFGLWMIFSPSLSGSDWLPLGAALVSGLAGALSAVMWKRLTYNPTQTSVVTWIITVVVNLPLAVILGEHFPSIGWHAEWFYLVVFGIASLLAVQATVQGLKLIEAGAAGILGLLEVVFAVLFGVVFFGERPGLIVLLGMASIIAAAAIPYVKDYNASSGTLDQAKS